MRLIEFSVCRPYKVKHPGRPATREHPAYPPREETRYRSVAEVEIDGRVIRVSEEMTNWTFMYIKPEQQEACRAHLTDRLQRRVMGALRAELFKDIRN